jgi:uncharacterized protein with GYD domain
MENLNFIFDDIQYGDFMSHYLIQGSYKAKTWVALVKEPKNRLDIAGPIIENLGGKIECAYITFGEYDFIAIVRIPEKIKAASLSMSLLASGAFKTVKTNLLLTWNDGIKAMGEAKKALYQLKNEDSVFLKRIG